MDTSETYIKMCEKAEEVQIKHWERGWREGDYFWDGEKAYLCGMDYLAISSFFKEGRSYARFAMREPMSALNFEQFSPMSSVTIKEGRYELKILYNGIWLPRQDQLQEMIDLSPILDTDISRCASLLSRFSHWYVTVANNFTSMEQLWLAFVMKEKYNKVWNGEDWVKEVDNV